MPGKPIFKLLAVRCSSDPFTIIPGSIFRIPSKKQFLSSSKRLFSFSISEQASLAAWPKANIDPTFSVPCP